MATQPAPDLGLSRSSGSQRVRRNRRSEFAIWWREIDRTLLFLVLSLMAIGTAAVAAASPASAKRREPGERQSY
jgi:cell division protein FtsW